MSHRLRGIGVLLEGELGRMAWERTEIPLRKHLPVGQHSDEYYVACGPKSASSGYFSCDKLKMCQNLWEEVPGRLICTSSFLYYGVRGLR